MCADVFTIITEDKQQQCSTDSDTPIVVYTALVVAVADHAFELSELPPFFLILADFAVDLIDFGMGIVDPACNLAFALDIADCALPVEGFTYPAVLHTNC